MNLISYAFSSVFSSFSQMICVIHIKSFHMWISKHMTKHMNHMHIKSNRSRKNRAKSIWENDLRVYLVSVSNNARINLYCRQQNWEDLISSLRKIITTKSKNTFLSQENNKLLLQQTIEWLLRYSLDGQAVKLINEWSHFILQIVARASETDLPWGVEETVYSKYPIPFI